ncbi:complement factor D [Cyprinodon tularosa]|uniref:trypsin n=1 Tax=Cyprinodon variegatus TaxID=28743 RepID=A0A3Q2CK81_CYPVA|nr:PREDICTED: complement factor D-like [Cyprinodon variegatus]XP_038160591.1 complement factor D [Cyprinodon tularosa]
MFPLFGEEGFKRDVSVSGVSYNTTMMSEKQMLLGTTVFFIALISHGEGIIGGREAVSHSRPYMASIQVPQEGGRLKHECGGFVIADQWVMTAVHCMPNGANGRKVVLGLHSLSEAEDTKQTFDILELHNHPDFSIDNYDNDIALIKLDRPFIASDAVRAVEFLRTGGTNPDPGTVVETAGWGSLDNLGSRPDKLNEVSIEVISPAKCRRTDYFGRKFTNNMICAHKVCRDSCGHSHGVEDSCDGDSGGPLLFNGTAVGITSNGGKKCGQLKKPGVYTIISHYTQWIDETMATQTTAAPEQSS